MPCWLTVFFNMTFLTCDHCFQFSFTITPFAVIFKPNSESYCKTESCTMCVFIFSFSFFSTVMFTGGFSPLITGNTGNKSQYKGSVDAGTSCQSSSISALWYVTTHLNRNLSLPVHRHTPSSHHRAPVAAHLRLEQDVSGSAMPGITVGGRPVKYISCYRR